VIVDGPNAGREFGISGATTVGRDPSAGIVIEDAEASRRHASLLVEGEIVTVEDLGSTNGSFLNGKRLAESSELATGDKLRVGTTVFELKAEVQATRVGTALPDLDDIQVTAPRQIPSFATDDATHVGTPAGTAGPPGGAPPTSAPPPAAAPRTSAPPPQATSPANAPPPGGSPPPPGAPYAGPPAPPAAGPPGYYGGGGPPLSGYPITLEADYPEGGIARWRPFLHFLMAFPHLFVVGVLALGAFFASVYAAIVIIFTGKYPRGVFDFIAGVLRWQARVNLFANLVTEEYPPFSLEDEPYPVRVRFQYPERIARWRPFVHWIMVLPHSFVLFFLQIAGAVAVLVAGLSILFTRKYPPGIFNFVVGVQRWQTRVAAFSYVMTEQYPPFELS
jgi:pSer/pThr/pTyr-binding forkhead associated (FHA) protein